MSAKVCREIGSEFEWSSEFLNETPSVFLQKGVRFFSGRTALYAVLRDALTHRTIRQAWLPSYCCASMIRPFSELNIPVRFYQVNRNEGGGVKREAFEPKADEIVLSMTYFGFADEEHEQLLRYADECGALTVEDCTHSLLMNDQHTRAHYRVASLRKWFPIACGGWATNATDTLTASLTMPPQESIDLRIQAMRQKERYLRDGGDEAVKQQYLASYREFNTIFDDPTVCYAIDGSSDAILNHLDIQSIRSRRRANAQMLLDGLAALTLDVWSASLGEEDCPLFLPLISPHAKHIQSFLAQNGIYSPMHWPRPCERAVSDLYDREVSLICDQRYDQQDMLFLLETLKRYCKEG